MLNGAIHTYKKEVVLGSKIYNFNDNCLPLIMDKITSMEIDDKADLELVDLYMKLRNHDYS